MSAESETREARLVQKRQLQIVIALSAGILLLEVAGGLLSGSLALLSDAGHVLTNVLALVLSLMAVRFSSLPATPAKTYGYHRIEILTALVNGALRLVREAVDVLLEATPADIDLDDVSRAIATVPGVVEVHDLHVWSITTGLAALSGHVRLDGMGRDTSDEMLNRIKQTVRDRFGIVHTTIQIESLGYNELGDVH